MESAQMRFDPQRISVATKCTFCKYRINSAQEKGLTPGVDPEATPACVNSCNTGAYAIDRFLKGIDESVLCRYVNMAPLRDDRVVPALAARRRGLRLRPKRGNLLEIADIKTTSCTDGPNI